MHWSKCSVENIQLKYPVTDTDFNRKRFFQWPQNIIGANKEQIGPIKCSPASPTIFYQKTKVKPSYKFIVLKIKQSPAVNIFFISFLILTKYYTLQEFNFKKFTFAFSCIFNLLRPIEVHFMSFKVYHSHLKIVGLRKDSAARKAFMLRCKQLTCDRHIFFLFF